MYNLEYGVKLDLLLINCFLRKIDGKIIYIFEKIFLYFYF